MLYLDETPRDDASNASSSLDDPTPTVLQVPDDASVVSSTLNTPFVPASLTTFPEEMLSAILYKLSARDVCSFAQVCCRWRDACTDPLVWRAVWLNSRSAVDRARWRDKPPPVVQQGMLDSSLIASSFHFDEGALSRLIVGVRAGGSITTKDDAMRSVVYLAAMHGNIRFINFLLVYSPTREQTLKFSLCGTSAEHEQWETVEWLLSQQGVEIDKPNGFGKTALLEVCYREEGSLELAAALVRAGASLKARDWDGRTPLLAAASVGKKPLVELLIKLGAKTGQRDDAGNTAFLLATRCKSATPELPLWLLDNKYAAVDEVNGRGENALVGAVVCSCDPDMLRALLARGVSPVQRDKYGGTALHATAVVPHEEVINMLRAKMTREDQEARDEFGATAAVRTALFDHILGGEIREGAALVASNKLTGMAFSAAPNHVLTAAQCQTLATIFSTAVALGQPMSVIALLGFHLHADASAFLRDAARQGACRVEVAARAEGVKVLNDEPGR